MMLDENNRKNFLEEIARQLGRPVRSVPSEAAPAVNNLAETRLSEFSQDQLCTQFIAFATDTLKVNCCLSKPDNAITDLLLLCEEYGRDPIIVSGDVRLVDLGMTQALQQHFQANIWQPELGELNIARAEKANVGVVYAEAGLTESGGVVLFSTAENGRSVSLLPTASIFVLRKSTLLPRVAQLAERLHQKALRGERMPSCINLIAGPSSTADIELIKVIGVHGPVHAAYLIIEDC